MVVKNVAVLEGEGCGVHAVVALEADIPSLAVASKLGCIEKKRLRLSQIVAVPARCACICQCWHACVLAGAVALRQRWAPALNSCVPGAAASYSVACCSAASTPAVQHVAESSAQISLGVPYRTVPPWAMPGWQPRTEFAVHCGLLLFKITAAIPKQSQSTVRSIFSRHGGHSFGV
jgi:hypothetical protein